MAKSRREQDIGARFEERFARDVGGQIQPGSGSGAFSKMDVVARVGDRKVLFSCKATKHASFSMSRHHFEEVVRAALGPGGEGALPAMAVEVGGGDTYVVMREDDWIDLAGTAGEIRIGDKTARKLRSSRVPAALREE